jgi:hypothetical protein
MNNGPYHDLLNPRPYELSQGQFRELCEVRDKLLLFAQLSGMTRSTGDNRNAMLFIRRTLLGSVFGDLGFQLTDILDDLTHVPDHGDNQEEH